MPVKPSMVDFWALPDKALHVILDKFVGLKDVCTINAMLSRKNNSIIFKKFHKIFSALTPRDVVLRSTSCLEFWVRAKIPVAGLKIHGVDCLDYSSETRHMETERLMIDLIPKLSPSSTRPFEVTFSVAGGDHDERLGNFKTNEPPTGDPQK